MGNFKDILFGACIICFIYNIISIITNNENIFHYISLILLIIYFILEIFKRINTHKTR